jgi:hypothetical protein
VNFGSKRVVVTEGSNSRQYQGMVGFASAAFVLALAGGVLTLSVTVCVAAVLGPEIPAFARTVARGSSTPSLHAATIAAPVARMAQRARRTTTAVRISNS